MLIADQPGPTTSAKIGVADALEHRGIPTAASAASNWHARLFAPVDISFLVCFRVAFAAIMLWHVARYFAKGEIESFYIAPKFHFTYFGFEWVQPWPGVGMYLHFFAMGLLAACILVGLQYRLAIVLFWLAFTYQFLLDKALYQNHYYLVCLISFLMIFLPAHRAASIDAWLRPPLRSATAPTWTLWLLRFQIGVPYFFGGIAKLNADWLRCEPMRQGMAEPHRTGIPLIGPFFTEEWMVVLFSYGGLLLDLLIVPLLLWRRTRLPAYLACLAFHGLNAIMFNIGIFPWFTMLATLVFFEPDWPRRLANRFVGLLPVRSRWPIEPVQQGQPAAAAVWPRLTIALLGLYVAVQLLVPLRHFAYPGDASWTEEGHLFAWHMMLRGKRSAVSFIATDPVSGQSGPINVNAYLAQRQATKIGKDPRMILQFAHYLADEARGAGFANVEIRAIVLTSLNGRKPQLLIDHNVDLAAQPLAWGRLPFIMPLTEPLRERPWDLPPEEWPEHVLVSQR